MGAEFLSHLAEGEPGEFCIASAEIPQTLQVPGQQIPGQFPPPAPLSRPQASGALREQLQLGQFGSQLLSVSSPPLPEGARWEVSPRLGKDAWMCRRGWAEDRAGHSSPGKRSSPVPSGAPGALPAVLFSVRETRVHPGFVQLQGGFWTLNPSPTLTFPGHFCWSLSQVAAVKFQGAHAELLAGVVEDEPAGLGSVEVSLCVLGDVQV